MKRRQFIQGAGAATVAAGTLVSGKAMAAPEYKWKMVTTWPKNFPGLGTGANHLADMIKQMTNGRIEVKVYGAGELVGALEIFDAVSRGTAEMGHGAAYYWKGKSTAAQFFSAVPFGLTAQEMNGWLYHGGGMELWQEVYDQFGLVAGAAGNTGVQMGGWFNKEINSVEDLKGLKMRIPGFAGEVLAKLGANPTNIPPGELYTSLERRTIDALEWVGPSMDLRMGFHKIAPYYYTGWHEPATELQFLVNKRTFDKLPADLQEILTTAMRVAAYDMTIQSHHESGMNWATMKAEFPNVQVKQFPPEVIQALSKANDELLAEHAANDELAKEILDSQAEYMGVVRQWTDIADRAYLNSFE